MTAVKDTLVRGTIGTLQVLYLVLYEYYSQNVADLVKGAVASVLRYCLEYYDMSNL